MSLSTKPYKGARDFYPEDKRLQKYMFGILRSVVERYGYEEYDAPVLEPIELYLAKTGDEIVNEQTYAFEDRGGRKVVIRPEMTPTVSRLVAGRRQELAYPLRWYSIPNLWRYERPQRGRLREHWQLNVDVFGVKPPVAEIEIMTLIDDVFKAFKADRSMYQIRINDRQLVNYVLEDFIGLNAAQSHAMGRLIDRMHKIDKAALIAGIEEILTADQRASGVTEKTLRYLEATSISELEKLLATGEQTDNVKQVLSALELQGISNASFDPTIMRGFDYYTGIVFEVYDTHPDNNRAMLGGGRYDGLVGMFGAAPVPTVGFGWGDVTLQNFLELHHLLPVLQPETQIYAVVIGEYSQEIQTLLGKIRASGVNVAADTGGRKIADQLKTASKKGVAYALIVGEEELSSNRLKLKNLATGDEQSVAPDEVADAVTGPAGRDRP